MTRLRTPLFVFLGGFLLFATAHVATGFLLPDGARFAALQNASFGGGWEFASNIKNYASFKRKGLVGTFSTSDGSGSAPAGDQKYEKVANIGLRTRTFADDEARIRDLIGAADALVQFEQRQGLEGRRALRLAIGVDPAGFDEFVDKVQAIAELTHLSIDKSDKTNEYRDLQAKRRALEKAREALAGLKSREGEIRAFVELESQILNLEQQIQALGVNLGEFDAENEFVTVKVVLAETSLLRATAKGMLERIADALVWTLFYYPLFWLGIAMCVFALFVGAHVLRMLLGLARAAEDQLSKRKGE